MPRTTRRRLLAAGLGGSALLLVGGGLRWLTAGYRLWPGEAAIGLSVKELHVVRALVEVFFPAADGLPSGVALGVHQRIDEEVWAQPPEMREDLRAAIQLLEHSPPFFGAAGRFSSLPPAEREAVFARLLTSDRDVVVQAAAALKQMAHLFYYGHPDTWRALAYDGPWVPQPRPPDSSVRYQQLLAAARAARPEGRSA